MSLSMYALDIPNMYCIVNNGASICMQRVILMLVGPVLDFVSECYHQIKKF